MTSIMLRTSELKLGAMSKIIEISAEPIIRERLLELGLAPGRQLKVLRALPFSGPIIVQSGSLTLVLRREEAEQIWVEA